MEKDIWPKIAKVCLAFFCRKSKRPVWLSRRTKGGRNAHKVRSARVGRMQGDEEMGTAIAGLS